MDHFIELHDKVFNCYRKISWKAYQNLSDDDKEYICKKERDALVAYVDSDSLNHENVLNEKIKVMKGKLLYYN